MKVIKGTLKFNGIYRAEVLDNNDPSKLGRIKVNVFGSFDGIEASSLPWAVPAMPIFTGSGDGFGFFSIPEVSSHVWCFFEAGDINQPVYFAEAPSGVYGLPEERDTDYPCTKVIKTKNGITITIDDKFGNEEIKITHPAGSVLTIDKSGKISIQGDDEIEINQSAGANITMDSSGNVTIQGNTVNINP